jgi:hypothetical protein
VPTPEQKKKLLKAKIAVALHDELLTLEDRTKHPAVGLAYWNV